MDENKKKKKKKDVKLRKSTRTRREEIGTGFLRNRRRVDMAAMARARTTNSLNDVNSICMRLLRESRRELRVRDRPAAFLRRLACCGEGKREERA